MNESGHLEFDVLLSFAGRDRDYARAIHDIAAANGLRIFLDEEFQHEIWGKNRVPRSYLPVRGAAMSWSSSPLPTVNELCTDRTTSRL